MTIEWAIVSWLYISGAGLMGALTSSDHPEGQIGVLACLLWPLVIWLGVARGVWRFMTRQF